MDVNEHQPPPQKINCDILTRKEQKLSRQYHLMMRPKQSLLTNISMFDYQKRRCN
jgi:hypothetical protein